MREIECLWNDTFGNSSNFEQYEKNVKGMKPKPKINEAIVCVYYTQIQTSVSRNE